nr:CS1 type fimbrial major subunit [Stenotrophomonas geniculata]
MNIKKTLLAATAALIIAPAVSFAADTAINVNVKAIVPDARGMSITTETGWDATQQVLRWDAAADGGDGAFEAFYGNLNVKSPAAVDAYLQATPALRDGDKSIGLSVKLGGAALNVGALNKINIANATEAAAGKVVEAKIDAVKPVTGFEAGTYLGHVTMMFESAISSR